MAAAGYFKCTSKRSSTAGASGMDGWVVSPSSVWCYAELLASLWLANLKQHVAVVTPTLTAVWRAGTRHRCSAAQQCKEPQQAQMKQVLNAQQVQDGRHDGSQPGTRHAQLSNCKASQPSTRSRQSIYSKAKP